MYRNCAYPRFHARAFDWLRRWWHGSSVQDWNRDQCPRCRGSDLSTVVREAPGFVLWRCERCDETYLA